MYYLYILLCDKALFYTGITTSLDKRTRNHKSGYSPHTKRYKSIELVYTENYLRRSEAEKREEQIKGWSKQKKRALIEGNLTKLRQLSKSKS